MFGTNRNRPWDKPGPVPGTNRDLSLLSSTVKSAFCPVCLWDGWGFVPGTIVQQGPSEKVFMCFVFLGFFSDTKKEPKPKLLSPDIFRWGRGFPHEEVGAKKFGMSLETQEIKLFWRDIPGFCWDIPVVPEKFEKKRFVQFSFPIFFGPYKTTLLETTLLRTPETQ